MGEARPQSADHLPFGPRRRQTAASPSGQLELPTEGDSGYRPMQTFSKERFLLTHVCHPPEREACEGAGKLSLWAVGLIAMSRVVYQTV